MGFVDFTDAETRIQEKVLARLKHAKEVEKRTYEYIGTRAGTSKNHIHDIYKGYCRLTLSMAFRIWEGLGGNVRELVDSDSEPFLKRLANMPAEKRDVLAKFIDLIDPEKDIPPSVNSLIELVKNLHEERFHENTTSIPPKIVNTK